jgi:hypothetical protein
MRFVELLEPHAGVIALVLQHGPVEHENPAWTATISMSGVATIILSGSPESKAA